MKFGHVEGTHEEITNFCKNMGMNPADYFQPVEAPTTVHAAWIALPIAGVFVTACLMLLIPSMETKYANLLFLASVLCSACAATSVQLKFNNAWATGIVGITGLVIALISINILSPSDIADYLRDYKTEKKEK